MLLMPTNKLNRKLSLFSKQLSVPVSVLPPYAKFSLQVRLHVVIDACHSGKAFLP